MDGPAQRWLKLLGLGLLTLLGAGLPANTECVALPATAPAAPAASSTRAAGARAAAEGAARLNDLLSPVLGPSTQPTLATVHPAKDPNAPLVLFLPGISDYRGMERRLVRGLVASGTAAQIEVYTWPAYSAGLGALMNYPRNREEAAHVTTILRDAHAAHPSQPTYIVAHSGGCGIAVWALEGLPADVRVDQVVLLAPAISPGYDLSSAMRHVRGKVYAFTSTADPVLGVMTKTFGTIDRVNSESAGLDGFVRPATADAGLYAEKLAPMPYRPEWAALGHPGDHIGPLEPRFAETVIAPLLVPGR